MRGPIMLEEEKKSVFFEKRGGRKLALRLKQ